MITIYDLKPRFQALLRPMTHSLYRLGISANSVTVFAMLACIAYDAWMTLGPHNRWLFLFLPAVMLFRMALNAVDGMLARNYDQQTKLGAMLNELSDVISDVALYAPFAMLPQVNGILVVGTVLLALLTEFAGVLGQVVGGSRRYDGPMGKSDRAFAFGLVGLLIGLDISIQPYLNAVFAILLALLGWTILNRVNQALRHANG